MKKYVASCVSILVLAVLLMPSISFAETATSSSGGQTVSELQKIIASLQAQIAALSGKNTKSSAVEDVDTTKTLFPDRIGSYRLYGGPNNTVTFRESTECDNLGEDSRTKRLGLVGEFCVKDLSAEYRDTKSNAVVFVHLIDITEGLDLYKKFIKKTAKTKMLGAYEVFSVESHEIGWFPKETYDFVNTQEGVFSPNNNGGFSYLYSTATGDSAVTKYLINKFTPGQKVNHNTDVVSISTNNKTTSPKGKITVDVKVNGSDTPKAVDHKDRIKVSWKSKNAVACAAMGHVIPGVDGKSWTKIDGMDWLPSSGTRELYATHQNLGYVKTLDIGVACYYEDLIGENAVEDYVYLPVLRKEVRGDNSIEKTFEKTPVGIFADLNLDKKVDGADLGLLIAAWGECPLTTGCPADLNSDRLVDDKDLMLLTASWSK
jgi:hypothetical protein